MDGASSAGVKFHWVEEGFWGGWWPFCWIRTAVARRLQKVGECGRGKRELRPGTYMLHGDPPPTMRACQACDCEALPTSAVALCWVGGLAGSCPSASRGAPWSSGPLPSR